MTDQIIPAQQVIQYRFDLQLGPDGHPWIRLQIATPALSISTVFPIEHAEAVVEQFTNGIREQAKKATQKQVDTITPDFTGIQVNGR
jgi:hypothetical protein